MRSAAGFVPFTPTTSRYIARILVRQLRYGEYPYLADMTEHAVKSGYNHADEFEFGLDLILDGLERVRGASR